MLRKEVKEQRENLEFKATKSDESNIDDDDLALI